MGRKAVLTRTSAPRQRAPSPDRYRLEGTYERLRRALLEGEDDGRIDQPLSYWVTPTDRRLPIAFLDRTLRDLLAEPLEELMQTQGVGQKKILAFFDLLRRAIRAESPHGLFEPEKKKQSAKAPTEQRGVLTEPAAVSDAVWSGWCEAILRAGFGDHPLGRVAPSLAPLPTVIWEKPLSEYAGRSLAQIRRLKTHGEKRVNAIIEVFAAIYEAVSTAALAEELQLELTPRFVPPTTRWILQSARDPSSLTVAEVRERLARPLVKQIDNDLDDTIARLVSERLGVDGPSPTVSTQARRLRVTRARVYQLLEECGRVMEVRWPEGRWLLRSLLERPEETDDEAIALIHAVRTLFFPA